MHNKRILLITDENFPSSADVISSWVSPAETFNISFSQRRDDLDQLAQHLIKNQYDLVLTPGTQDTGEYWDALNTIKAQHLGKVVGYGIGTTYSKDYDDIINPLQVAASGFRNELERALGIDLSDS